MNIRTAFFRLQLSEPNFFVIPSAMAFVESIIIQVQISRVPVIVIVKRLCQRQ